MTVCDREELVLDVLRTGRALADTELAAHVTACAPCTDLVAVASALLDDQHVVLHDAPVPTSGVVWWRMQRRAREESMRVAARTVTAAQAISVGGAIAIALAIVGATADWRAWLKSAAGLMTVDLAPTALALWSIPLALALVACLALAPVAVYLSLERD